MSVSIFSGPHVESSFSVIGDIIDKKSGRMKVNIFSSIQTIKYALRVQHPVPCTSRAVKVYNRKDGLYTPVNPLLSSNMRSAKSRYNASQKKESEDGERKLKQFNS